MDLVPGAALEVRPDAVRGLSGEHDQEVDLLASPAD
jgi:hypothetical protein